MKKIVAMIMALSMVMCFAGCGSGSESTEQNETAAEPNAGIQGIVYTIPDGWQQTDIVEGSYSLYTNPDSDVEFGVSAVDEDELKIRNEELGENFKTVQEYYEKGASMSEDELKDLNAEKEAGEVSGTEATVFKYKKGDEGYIDIDTSWVYDGVMYDLWIIKADVYDDNGFVKDDAVVFTDEEQALYDSIMASVAPGDGAKY